MKGNFVEVFADLRGYAVILVNSKHKGVIFPYAPVSSFLVCVPKYVLYQFIGTAQNFLAGLVANVGSDDIFVFAIRLFTFCSGFQPEPKIFGVMPFQVDDFGFFRTDVQSQPYF